MPGRMRPSCGGVRMTPFLTTKMLEAAPSVKKPSRSMIASAQPASTACWRRSTLASKDTALRSHFAQRMSGTVIAPTPASRSASLGATSGDVKANTVGATPIGKAWSRLSSAPRVTCR